MLRIVTVYQLIRIGSCLASVNHMWLVVRIVLSEGLCLVDITSIVRARLGE